MEISDVRFEPVSGSEEEYKGTTQEAEKERYIPLDLSCCEVNGLWGIFVRINGRMLLVDNPDDLVTSVFRNGEIDLYYRDESEPVNTHLDIQSTIEGATYQWTMKSIDRPNLLVKYGIELAEYQRSVKNALSRYLEVYKAGKPTYWEENWNLRVLPLGLLQLDVTATLPTVHEPKMQDVPKENFIFEPLGDEFNDMYKIGIGNRCYDIWVDHEYFDLNYIRLKLEDVVRKGEAHIELPYDDNFVTFKQVDGCMRVEIESEQYGEKPSLLTGYCDGKQAVRSFYEGLLKQGLLRPKTVTSREAAPVRIDFYNIFKSPLLEDYITGKESDRNVPETRQPVREMVIVSPCHDALGYEANSESLISVVDTATDEIKIAGCIYTLQGASDRMQDYHTIQAALEAGQDTASTNRKRFNEQGMALARALRTLLPADIDVWYKSPLEDKASAINTLVI